jgi:hypothetical protein
VTAKAQVANKFAKIYEVAELAAEMNAVDPAKLRVKPKVESFFAVVACLSQAAKTAKCRNLAKFCFLAL